MINNFYNERITKRVHEFIKPLLDIGDFAIDATMGQGYDTLFLHQQVGDKGLVIGFDIQEKAISMTQELIGKTNSVQYIMNSHEYINDYLPIIDNQVRKPKVIMFNLGYLPGGEKTITTEVAVTQKSIIISLDILANNGLLSVVTYPGHEEGAIEDEEISQLFSQLPSKQYEVILILNHNRSNKAPKHYLVYKKNL